MILWRPTEAGGYGQFLNQHFRNEGDDRNEVGSFGSAKKKLVRSGCVHRDLREEQTVVLAAILRRESISLVWMGLLERGAFSLTLIIQVTARIKRHLVVGRAVRVNAETHDA